MFKTVYKINLFSFPDNDIHFQCWAILYCKGMCVCVDDMYVSFRLIGYTFIRYLKNSRKKWS